MTSRIEPPMTRSRSGGAAKPLGLVALPKPSNTSSPSEYVKYPRAAKAVFALAAATVAFAIVQSAAILVVTAWLLLVGYILWIGCRLIEVEYNDHNSIPEYGPSPAGLDLKSQFYYEDMFRRHS